MPPSISPSSPRSASSTLKIEGRKKKPEYVATVTRSYRDLLQRVSRGEQCPALCVDHPDLVQIFSRGFTGGMFGGRAGREYITRLQPDNRGVLLGTVTASGEGELIVEVSSPVVPGDGLGFEPPAGVSGRSVGFTVARVRTIVVKNGVTRQAIPAKERVPAGWSIYRTSQPALIERARASFAGVAVPTGRVTRLDARVIGNAGAPLTVLFSSGDDAVTLRSAVTLAPASKRSLDQVQLREQLGRLGGTRYVLGAVDDSALSAELFLPVSELNALRQEAVARLDALHGGANESRHTDRRSRIAQAVAALEAPPLPPIAAFALAAEVFTVEEARIAADAGATEIVFDPFLRHPVPAARRVASLGEELQGRRDRAAPPAAQHRAP